MKASFKKWKFCSPFIVGYSRTSQVLRLGMRYRGQWGWEVYFIAMSFAQFHFPAKLMQ